MGSVNMMHTMVDCCKACLPHTQALSNREGQVRVLLHLGGEKCGADNCKHVCIPWCVATPLNVMPEHAKACLPWSAFSALGT